MLVGDDFSARMRRYDLFVIALLLFLLQSILVEEVGEAEQNEQPECCYYGDRYDGS